MKLEVKNETYNRFLKRKELDLFIEHPEESTPSTANIQQLLAKQINAEVEKVEVKNIISSRGSPVSKSLIFVWDEKKIAAKTAKEVKETEKANAEPKEEKSKEEKESAGEAKEAQSQ